MRLTEAEPAQDSTTAEPTSGRRGRWIRVGAWTFIHLGWMLLAVTVFQLWGTGLATAQAQADLAQRLATRWEPPTVETDPTVSINPVDPGAPPAAPSPQEAPVDASTLLTEKPPEMGEPIGRIVIPKANVDHVMVEGVTPEVLRTGPGHMPWTPLPGQPGNAVVSGHRTTYGAPFFDLDLLEPGDPIFVETAIGRHTYVVRETLIVDPTEVWVTETRPGAWLTLTTCTPKFSAAKRLIIFAELTEGPNVEAIASLDAAKAPNAAS